MSAIAVSTNAVSYTHLANPSPPVGPALGSKGINIMEFCKQFNARTQDKAGKILPVIITYYADKSFDFVIKTPPVAIQLLEVAKVKSGSAEPNRKKVAELTWDCLLYTSLFRVYLLDKFSRYPSPDTSGFDHCIAQDQRTCLLYTSREQTLS